MCFASNSKATHRSNYRSRLWLLPNESDKGMKHNVNFFTPVSDSNFNQPRWITCGPWARRDGTARRQRGARATFAHLGRSRGGPCVCSNRESGRTRAREQVMVNGRRWRTALILRRTCSPFVLSSMRRSKTNGRGGNGTYEIEIWSVFRAIQWNVPKFYSLVVVEKGRIW